MNEVVKGASGPEEWRPPDEDYWCEYAMKWTGVKARWELTMTEPEAEAVFGTLDPCEIPPAVPVVQIRKASP